jgi:two-component system cell cycle sensor histidine kinase/response regulator CckA
MSKKSILVVDDDPVVAKLIEMRLQKLGYEVPAVTSTGDEAISLAALLSPDAVIMDIMIPGEIDGIEAANIICSEYDIPVVYLTADTERSTFERAKVTRGCEYLVKPFSDDALYIAIELAVHKNEMYRETKRLQEYYPGIASGLSIGVITADREGSVVYMNPAAGEMTGSSGSPSIRDAVHIVSGDGRPLEDPLEKVLTTGDSWTFPADAMLAGPDTLPVGGFVAPIRNEVGEPDGILMLIFPKTSLRVLKYRE